MPARFLTTTAHLIAILTVLIDVVSRLGLVACAATAAAGLTRRIILLQRSLAGQILLAHSSDAALYSAAQLDATAHQ